MNPIDPVAAAGLANREVRTGERDGATTRIVVARRTYGTDRPDLWEVGWADAAVADGDDRAAADRAAASSVEFYTVEPEGEPDQDPDGDPVHEAGSGA